MLWAGGKVTINPTLPPPNEDIRYVPTVINGIDYSSPPHGLIFLHADKGVTFDLDAIRRANRGYKLVRFRAMSANMEIHTRLTGVDHNADLWVFVDGQERFARKKINGYSGAAPVAVPISERDRYLTLVGTDGGDGIGGDWLIFGDPVLEMLVTEKEESPR